MPEPTAREIPDKREAVGADKVRLWFDLGHGNLRCCIVARWQQDPETIERIGATLAAEGPHVIPRKYGDG